MLSQQGLVSELYFCTQRLSLKMNASMNQIELSAPKGYSLRNSLYIPTDNLSLELASRRWSNIESHSDIDTFELTDYRSQNIQYEDGLS